MVVGYSLWWIVKYSLIDSHHRLNLLKDRPKVSGAFRGILFPPSSSSFFIFWKAAAWIFANAAMDLSSSSSEDRRFRLAKGGGRLLGVDCSEEGSESSVNPAGVIGPLGELLTLFPPWRSALWELRRVSRSKPISLCRAALSSFSLT